MSSRGVGKRERLVAAARRVVHEQGVERTTLADIAAAADIPVGNVYYYFKTKDALVAAVIDDYRDDFDRLIADLDRGSTPTSRLKELVRTWSGARQRLAQHGCPVGTLSSELGKREGQLDRAVADVLARMISWAEGQFRQLGRHDARELAIALVAAYEGIAVIANALQNPELVTDEGRRLDRWIDSIADGADGR